MGWWANGFVTPADSRQQAFAGRGQGVGTIGVNGQEGITPDYLIAYFGMMNDTHAVVDWIAFFGPAAT